jgi:hypothetical protein
VIENTVPRNWPTQSKNRLERATFLSSRLRRDLKHNSLAAAAADRGCAKEIAALVADQAIIWVSPIRPFAERMDYTFLPLAAGFWSELEYHAVAVTVAAGGSCSVQIAVGVEH